MKSGHVVEKHTMYRALSWWQVTEGNHVMASVGWSQNFSKLFRDRRLVSNLNDHEEDSSARSFSLGFDDICRDSPHGAWNKAQVAARGATLSEGSGQTPLQRLLRALSLQPLLNDWAAQLWTSYYFLNRLLWSLIESVLDGLTRLEARRKWLYRDYAPNNLPCGAFLRDLHEPWGEVYDIRRISKRGLFQIKTCCLVFGGRGCRGEFCANFGHGRRQDLCMFFALFMHASEFPVVLRSILVGDPRTPVCLTISLDDFVRTCRIEAPSSLKPSQKWPGF